jgi:hypothetical protein
MARYPSAQQPPRVPRSRRDDHYNKGYALPPKRAGVGTVVSRQGDTVTVQILDEELSYCIPLTTLPPVGTIVELEARGDLMVILDWSAADGQPVLGSWYFIYDESPNWEQYPNNDAPMGVGLEVANTDPEGPGVLWNRNDFSVRPGETVQFSMLTSQLLPSDAATVQLVLLWAEHGDDPQPSNGEVVAYGPEVSIDGELIEFDATATVPDDFDKPPGGGSRSPTGRARVGLRYTPGASGSAEYPWDPPGPADAIPVGSNTFAGAAEITEYGFSPLFPNAGYTVEAGEPIINETAMTTRTAWWKVTPAVSGLMMFVATGNTTNAIYTGSSIGNLTCLGADYAVGGGPHINVEVTAGTTYYIQQATYGDTDRMMQIALYEPFPCTVRDFPMSTVTKLANPQATLGDIVGGSGALSTPDDASYIRMYGGSQGSANPRGAFFTGVVPAAAITDIGEPVIMNWVTRQRNGSWQTYTNGSQNGWMHVMHDSPSGSYTGKSIISASDGVFGERNCNTYSITTEMLAAGPLTVFGDPHADLYFNAYGQPTDTVDVSYCAIRAYYYAGEPGVGTVDLLMQGPMLGVSG